MRPINVIVLVDHGDRVAAGVRPRLGDQQGPQRVGADRHARHGERRRRGEPDRFRLGDGHDHAADQLGLRGRATWPTSCERSGGDDDRATRPARRPAVQRTAAARADRAARLPVDRRARAGCSRSSGRVLNSFRDYAYTPIHGYVSFGGFTFQNYMNAWNQGDFGLHFWNSVVITVPAVLLTLFLASCMAFVLARFSFRFNLALLGIFLAAQPAAAASAAHPDLPDVPRRRRCRTGCPAPAPCSTPSWASSWSTSRSSSASARSCCRTT